MNVLSFPICGLLIILLVNILFFAKKRIKTTETKIYSYLILVDLIEAIFAVLGLACIINFGNTLFMQILVKIDYALLLLWASLLFQYTASLYLVDDKRINKLMRISTFINIILSIIILFLPVDIIVSDHNVDSHGLSTMFLFCCIFLFLIFILFLIIKLFISKSIRDNRRKLIPMISLVFIIIMLIIIKTFIPEIVIQGFAISFVSLIMFFTIENPDVKMIAALNEAKLSAEKANRAKSDFLSNMSHEIRTPLNAIVGFSDCILEEETLESAKEDAKNVRLASDNLLEIVNGILDISKIEANKMEIVETEYNPLENLDNVAKLVKPRIGDKPIDLIVKFAPDIPYTLYGDCGKIRQLVTNILTNAVKYTKEGSIIFCVNCVNEANYTKLVISVEDTGRGIKTEQIDKLFTKFQRLDEDKNTTLEGTGLGLAITKRFVEMMGGKIVVQSKYGEGSKFTVYLRQRIVMMNKPEEKETEKLIDTMQIKLLDFSNSKVLVVDDNKININVALKLLSKYGINADSSESGFGALDKLNSGKKYDLILLDDMMPKMSGVETLKHIREDFVENIPVVALTANALSDMRDKYLAAGFDDYLSKPIEKSELYRVLVTYLNNKLEKKNMDDEEKLEKDDKLSNMENGKINKKTVLIVDDNKINIKIAEKLLSHFDYLEVDSTLSGKEAIEKVKEKNYDLVFMDIMMPEMDGIETFHYLRENLGFENPVITLTADAVEGSREKYLNEGFNDYLAKPISIEDMEKIIDKFIKKV